MEVRDPGMKCSRIAFSVSATAAPESCDGWKVTIFARFSTVGLLSRVICKKWITKVLFITLREMVI